MEREAFNRVVAAGALTWEEKNPINFVHYPLHKGDARQPTPENIQKINQQTDKKEKGQQK